MQANDPKQKEEEQERIIRQITQWGATQADIDKFKEDHQGELLEVEQDAVIWNENKTTVRIFLALASQWNIQPMTGQRIGLNKSAVEIEIRNTLELVSSTKQKHAEIYHDITAMEHAAIAQIRKQEREHK